MRRSLFTKYVILFVGLVTLVLTINAALDFYFTYEDNRRAAIAFQREKADNAAQRIESFVREIERQIGWVAHPQWALLSEEQRKFDYVRLQRQVPAIAELSFIDRDGREQLKVSRLLMDVFTSGLDRSSDPAFVQATANRLYFGPVYFHKESEPHLTMAVSHGGRGGVTVAVINLKLAVDVISQIRVGEGGYAYVVDGKGRLIAHPDMSLVLRGTDMSKLPQVAAALRQGGVIGETRDLQGVPVLSSFTAIPALDWLVFVEMPTREARQPAIDAGLRALVLLAGGILIAALAGALLARRMVVPIRALQSGAARIGGGDLGHRLDIRTGDELEALAQQFNHSAEALEESYATLEQRVTDRTRELSESLEQQIATAEILRVISQSPTDVQPVLNVVVSAARRFCGASDAVILLKDGDATFVAAHDGELSHSAIGSRFPLDRTRLAGESILERHTVQLTDLQVEGEDHVMTRELARRLDFNASVSTPLIREDVAIGCVSLRKRDNTPYTPRQIALVEAFAAQAVIAIENVRLFTELRESLEQQTATAEILRVISQSPTDVQPVLNVVAAAACRFCGASDTLIALRDGADMIIAAHVGPIATRGGGRVSLDSGRASSRAIIEARTIHYPDVNALDPAEHAAFMELARTQGFQAVLATPMMREDAAIGCILLRKPDAGAFAPRQVELLEAFAAQAVIAIENVRLFTELSESLEQQTATAEILRVISQSPTDVQPVLKVVVAAARRFCGAADALIALSDGQNVTVAVHEGPLGAALGEVAVLDRGRPSGRAIVEGRTIHLPDLSQLDPVEFATTITLGRVHGFKAALSAPLLQGDTAVGAVVLRKPDAVAFTPRQIALLEAFAAQAVIAIENVRLFTELRDSLEQQTATTQVLQVINASPGDLAPVFGTVLEKAMALCEADFGFLTVYDGSKFRAAAMRGVPDALAQYFASGMDQPQPGEAHWRVLQGEDIIHTLDQKAEEVYRLGTPLRRAVVDLGGARTALVIALRRDDVVRGALTVYRKEVRAFSDKDIALMQNFAAQAVIAMENARLITELRETLEQQTATAEVLRVISQSPTVVQPVLDVVVSAARRFCGATDAVINLRDGDEIVVAAHDGSLTVGLGDRRPFDRSSGAGRAISDGRTIHIPDIATLDPVEFATTRALAREHGYQAVIAAPMLREGATVGSILLRKSEAGAFTPRQVELLETFAAQAVIAIENVRLFTELSESLEQQTATAEILQVISQSPTDVAPVLTAVAKAAVRFCGARDAVIYLRDGDSWGTFAHEGPMEAPPVGQRLALNRETSPGRAIIDGRTAHFPDIAALDPVEFATAHRYAGQVGIRATLAAPMLREGVAIGAIALRKPEVGPFAPRQIQLLEAFAAQAVIAIENVRLFTEIQDKSHQLEVASQHKSQFLANMSHELRTPLNAILGYTEMMADGLYGDLNERATGVLERVQSNGRHLLGLINDVLDLSKIEAGQLTLSIEPYSVADMVSTVVSATESLARTKGLRLESSVANGLPSGTGDVRRLSQVLLNLVGNALKFTDQGGVEIRAVQAGDRFALSVVDTGPGIAAEDQAKIFDEFQQVDNTSTRKKGGTGLGLSISRKIVALHGGAISVQSELGKGSTFTVSIPIHAAAIKEAAQ